jgi:hypothetical protein
MSDPKEWRITQDKEGFYVEDEYAEEVCEKYGCFRRYTRLVDAEVALRQMVNEYWDNYDGPNDSPQDDPDFAGFADNH